MKTAMINTLKKINRTVLEMDLGILFLGVSAQIIGAFIAKDGAMYAKSLWFGVLLALFSIYHMYRSLDRALDQPEKTATKMIIRAYVLRYVVYSGCMMSPPIVLQGDYSTDSLKCASSAYT